MESFSFRFPASWYEGDRKEAFGQKKYHVPVEAEKALTEHFGDWNTLPPESERVFHEYADRMIETTEDDYVFYDEIT